MRGDQAYREMRDRCCRERIEIAFEAALRDMESAVLSHLTEVKSSCILAMQEGLIQFDVPSSVVPTDVMESRSVSRCNEVVYFREVLIKHVPRL